MTDGLVFGRKIRTAWRAQPIFPVFIQSVGDAIDRIHVMPEGLKKKPVWSVARRALWAALDHPDDADKLTQADKAFCAALEAEGWLDEIKAG